MTPLSDALTAAQRRALQAVEKAWLAGMLSSEDATAALERCGVNDPVELNYLGACLEVLREWGAPLPAEPSNGKPADEPASDKQTKLIADLLERKGGGGGGTAVPEGLTKAQASEVIDSLQAGTYDPAKWSVPF